MIQKPKVNMKINITNHRRNQRPGLSAFTLIELMLVLVILGILAAIVVPKFTGITLKGKTTGATTQLSAFATSIDLFEVDNGHYPKTLNDLMVQPRDATSWHQYMEQIPLDPWGHPYVYTCPGKHRPNSYDLMSMGPDGKVGGDDDIVNWQANK
jgi:general secretion pathway protein G